MCFDWVKGFVSLLGKGQPHPNPLPSEGEGVGRLPATPFNWYPPTHPVLLIYQPCCRATRLIYHCQGGRGVLDGCDGLAVRGSPTRPFDGAQGERPRPVGWIHALAHAKGASSPPRADFQTGGCSTFSIFDRLWAGGMICLRRTRSPRGGRGSMDFYNKTDYNSPRHSTRWLTGAPALPAGPGF